MSGQMKKGRGKRANSPRPVRASLSTSLSSLSLSLSSLRVRGNVSTLVRVEAQVEDFRDAQLGVGLDPHPERAWAAHLTEHKLPVVEAEGRQVAIV